MLFELPTSDEIDALAVTSPHIEVRKIEIDISSEKADLNYAPCKAQVVLVTRGPNGTALARTAPSVPWRLPSGRVASNEDVQKAVRRISGEFGISVKSMELSGIYDVVWHYADISIKRLHLAYEVLTDDEEPGPSRAGTEVRFFRELPVEALADEVSKAAIADCTQK